MSSSNAVPAKKPLLRIVIRWSRHITYFAVPIKKLAESSNCLNLPSLLPQPEEHAPPNAQFVASRSARRSRAFSILQTSFHTPRAAASVRAVLVISPWESRRAGRRLVAQQHRKYAGQHSMHPCTNVSTMSFFLCCRYYSSSVQTLLRRCNMCSCRHRCKRPISYLFSQSLMEHKAQNQAGRKGGVLDQETLVSLKKMSDMCVGA
jgi:hypothetical protein